MEETENRQNQQSKLLPDTKNHAVLMLIGGSLVEHLNH
jgi:hypothetical protein